MMKTENRIDPLFFRHCGVAAVCLVLACGLAIAWQAPALEHFVPYLNYVVEVDGQPAPDSEVWISSKPVALLVREPRLSQAALLRPGQPDLEAMALSYLTGNDARLDVSPGHKTVKVGHYSVSGTTVSFRFEDHDVMLKVRPPLLGIHSSAEILEFDPSWGERAGRYVPDPAMIEKARTFSKQAKVTVYFGSWCSHCQAHVPFIMQSESALKGSTVGFEYYGLPNGFGDEPQAEKYGIKLIPTAIVWVGGREVGRIEGDDWDKPEAKLARLLSP